VDDAVADLCRLVRCDDPPATLGGTMRGLVEQLLAVAGERIRANALEERRRRTFLELVSLQSSASRGVRQCFQVEERSGGAGAEISEVTCRNAQGEDALTDPVEVDADLRRAC